NRLKTIGETSSKQLLVRYDPILFKSQLRRDPSRCSSSSVMRSLLSQIVLFQPRPKQTTSLETLSYEAFQNLNAMSSPMPINVQFKNRPGTILGSGAD
ncbi:MAG: hypothetical protein AAFU78_13215, partial [Cyanobacteria bacterium J06633_2]